MRQVTGDDAGKPTSLNAKLEDQLKQGAVKVGSGDVADFGKSERGAATAGPLPAPDLSEKSPPVEAATLADAAPKQMAQDSAEGEDSRESLNALVTDVPDEVELTNKERETFIESLISGARFELPFSIYGGKVTGVIRSRSQAETIALIRYLNQERREGRISDMLEYATHLRNALLAAQIKMLNDTEYANLTEPLHRTVKGKETEEPGWLDQMQYWSDQQEGLVSAIYHKLRLFEKKYWVMVDGADDQNFLNPEGSTSE